MDPKISIYVCYHKPAYLIGSCETLIPIQSGRALSEVKLPMIGDDPGDNISAKEEYSELRALYWAWKNDKTSDYIGLFHYRRILDFFQKTTFAGDTLAYEESARLTQDILGKYLNDAVIRETLKNCDVILPAPFYPKKSDASTVTVREQFKKYHDFSDYELAEQIVKESCPDYAEDFEKLSAAESLSICNMFIAKRDIFERYCAWLFPILERLGKQFTKDELYALTNFRRLGYIAERLLNVFIGHEQRINPELRIGYLNTVFFKNTLPVPAEPPLPETNLPIRTVVMSVSPSYPPYAAAAIASLLSNAAKDIFIDLIILHGEIKAEDKERLEKLKKLHPHALISFVDLSGEYENLEISSHITHINQATFYRLIIFKHDFLKTRDKVLYLDSDLIVLGDINKVFTVDLEGNPIAAVSDFLMQLLVAGSASFKLNGKNLLLKEYIWQILHIKKPETYFNTGVVLYDLEKIRETDAYRAILESFAKVSYLYCEQCAQNRYFNGKVKYLPYAFNLLFPASDQSPWIWIDASYQLHHYKSLVQNPLIVHYAGAEKPWNTPDYKFFAYHFWHYLRMTGFYEEVFAGMVTKAKRFRYKHAGIYHIFRKIWQKMPLSLRESLRPLIKFVVRKL